MTDPEPTVSRRGFIWRTAGATTLAGATGGANAQQTGTGTATPTGTQTGGGTATGGGQTGTGTGDGTAAGGGTAGGGGGQTHTVAMTDDLVFDPDSITIAPGDTIVWENTGSIGHSVTAYGDQIPEDAEYFASGGFDSQSAAVSSYTSGDPDAGYIGEDGTYEHTFEVAGEHEYFCIPHETAGMVGSVTVSAGAGQGGGGGGTPAAPQVPSFATNVAMALAVGLLTVLSFTYLFIRFGGDYSFDEGE